jgi:hypothetical protein
MIAAGAPGLSQGFSEFPLLSTRSAAGWHFQRRKARGRNRIAGNFSARSRPLAPPQPQPRIAIAGDVPRGAASRLLGRIDYTAAGAASGLVSRLGHGPHPFHPWPGAARLGTMPDVLYRAADGSWQRSQTRPGIRPLYRLKARERWALLDDDRVMVVHPDRPPKVVYPDGRVEEIAPTSERITRDARHG